MSLDDHIRRLSDTIIGELRAPIEVSLHNLLQEVLSTAGRERDDLIATAVRERDEAIAEARRERDDEVAQAIGGANARQEAAIETALDAARAEADERVAQAIAAANARQEAAIETALDAARAEAEERVAQAIAAANARQEAAIESALDAARAETDARVEQAAALWRAEAEQQLQQSLDAVGSAAQVEAREAAEAARAAALAEQQQALCTLEADLRRSQDDLERLHGERAGEVNAALAALTADHESRIAALMRDAAAERDAAVQAVRDEAARERAFTLAGLEERDEEVRASAIRDALAGERQADLACSERLVDAIRRLDTAQSLGEVLTTLADHVADEAGRSALLIVEGTRLRGWRLAGFAGLHASDLYLPFDEAGALGRAATSGLAVATSPGATDDLPALLVAPGGRAGLAVPLLVGQRTVVVLYADDAGGARSVAPSNWPEVAEVLARHAARCLEVMTIARVSGPLGKRVLPGLPPAEPPARGEDTAVASPAEDGPDSDTARQAESAQRYARLLLSEVKLYNESAVEEGRREHDLLARLGSEIERARRLYEEKIPAVVRERADWFEQELVRTLAGGDAALLGQVT